ncbi:hypothetical protein PMZ80_008052 [Knufia obscura]|uniref:Uncharacterized protein n=1 Tax=Knufia obscura TaxID=1635080 RepID=A0ABR0RGD3_9EURO|nr:hypothetical protein PMZ80_008052 [Knufia obscura]
MGLDAYQTATSEPIPTVSAPPQDYQQNQYQNRYPPQQNQYLAVPPRSGQAGYTMQPPPISSTRSELPRAPVRRPTYSESILNTPVTAASDAPLPAQQPHDSVTQAADPNTSQVRAGTRRPRPATDSPTGSNRATPDCDASSGQSNLGRPSNKYAKYK